MAEAFNRNHDIPFPLYLVLLSPPFYFIPQIKKKDKKKMAATWGRGRVGAAIEWEAAARDGGKAWSRVGIRDNGGGNSRCREAALVAGKHELEAWGSQAVARRMWRLTLRALIVRSV
jgi:hypothetical protein